MKEYTISIGGLPHTVQLDDAEAARRGLDVAVTKQAAPAKNKGRAAKNKAHGDTASDD